MALHIQSAEAINTTQVVAAVAHTASTATVITMVAKAAVVIQELVLITAHREHITVAVAEQAVIQIQVQADPAIRVLLLYDTDLDKVNKCQR
tara:strand:- start:605 stop:880 length:276 start_codon:yes stop_codon:yes gene_type:complete